ncbi:MAG: hypothetical protein EOP51_05170 [Sphingobacteriales bacterium]|nr:MAG: hypothetical protein EOP51_05170 [Sphingobacteriales bacterium]
MYKSLLLVAVLCFLTSLCYGQSINDSANSVQLKNVDVLSDVAKYHRDSVNMAQIYKKVYEDATRKPKSSIFGQPSPIGLSIGVQYEGLVSAFARKISGKQKSDKRFINDFKHTQANKFIDLKYNPEIVRGVVEMDTTGIPEFIRAYPMEESYARTASALEIKMWIRSNFRDWITKRQVSGTQKILQE